MSKAGMATLVCMVLIAGMAMAENGSKAAPGKAITLKATVSENGRLLMSARGETWTVTNTEAVQGYEGRQVVVKGVETGEHRVRVVQVRLNESTYRANVYDAAFRR